jgi:predicted nucleic-acid-binding protein
VRVAVDTNVLVRLVTNDDAAQAQAARGRLEGHEVFLGKSVLLETEWVLRYTYGLDRATIAAVFRKLLGLRGAVVESQAEVITAVEWYEQGLDFADSLHLASARDCEELATFDRRFSAAAGKVDTRVAVKLVS